MRRFKIHTFPQVKYFGKSISGDVYCSRTDTVKELISQLCNSSDFMAVAQGTGDELTSKCRMWKMEGDETFQDIENSLDTKNLPNEVPGRVL